MTTDDDFLGIGPAQARQLSQWILEITARARKGLITDCSAKCPPGKNKRLNRHNTHPSNHVRRAA